MYRLLIVDEDETICSNIKTALDWNSYGVTSILTAASYNDAVLRTIDFSPHMAFVNVRLGEHFGYDLVNHLRCAGLKTVFCMLSDVEDCRLLKKSMQASAQDFLLTPAEPAEIRAFVEQTIVRELHGILPKNREPSNEIDPILHVEYARFSKITNKIILLVKGDYRSSQSLTRIAETFNMSSKYIGRIFLKDTGMKFTNYLTAYRMLEAKRLLESTQEKIFVIAGMVGYSQLNNFYTHFKNYFGISPSTMRSSGALGTAEEPYSPEFPEK